MTRTTYYFRASTILVAVMAAALLSVLLLAQKPAEAGVVIDDGICLSCPTDTTPPNTSITSADLGTTNDNTPTFSFTGTDNVGVTGFECRVYVSGSPAPAFSNCASPYTAAALSDGDYVFEVRAKDAAGNVDATPATSSFTVSTPTQGGDTTAPRVVSTVPTANATGVAATTNVTATFSEDMLASSIITPARTFKLVRLNADGTTTGVTATVSYDAATKQAILDPSSDLSPGLTYKATVTSGAQDLAGNPLDQKPNIAGNQSKSWKFTVQ